MAPSAAAAPGTATRPAAAPGSRVFSNPSAAPATGAAGNDARREPGAGLHHGAGQAVLHRTRDPTRRDRHARAYDRRRGASGVPQSRRAPRPAPVRPARPPFGRTPRSAGRPTTMASGAAMRAGGTSGGFEFNDLPMPDNIRIIHIPLDKLKNGDVRYNVVIRPKDVIIVPLLPQGEYFMGGHVARPAAVPDHGQPDHAEAGGDRRLDAGSARNPGADRRHPRARPRPRSVRPREPCKDFRRRSNRTSTSSPATR